MIASAASTYVCPVDDAAEPFVVGVVVAPDDVAADHAGLLFVGGVVGPVERDLAIFLISRRCTRVNFGTRPPLYLGYSELNPSALKLRITSRTRSSLVKGHLRDPSHVHPLGRQQHHLRLPPGHHRPAAPAHDPQQALALVIVDLTHSQAICHRPSVGDQLPQRGPRTSKPGRAVFLRY